MQENELESASSKEAKLFSNQITIAINPVSRWEKALAALSLLKRMQTFTIPQSYLGTNVQIATTILLFNKNSDHADIQTRAFQLVSDNTYLAAKVVAYAIRNSPVEPSERFISRIMNGLYDKELTAILTSVLDAMNIPAFFESLNVLTQVNILSEPSQAA